MTERPLFGTDGIRGPFGSPPLDRDTVRRLGTALAVRLTRQQARPRILLAGDTRDSTPKIGRWLAQSLEPAGCEVLYAGVLPSPAISQLVRDMSCSVGVAISASHNPYPDNGIKLIAADGSKWTSGSERELEEGLRETALPSTDPPVTLSPDTALGARYLDLLTEMAGEGKPLAGLRVTLDCANGAASGIARELFTRLGADVESLGDRPDGRNINDGCGSTQPEGMAAVTSATGSQVGFAFDGDADRVIVADETGRVHDGDAILFLLGTHLHASGALRTPALVATSMSNLGLEVALRQRGISLVRCDVGDREVVRALRREGLMLGGEQSGHIIHLGLGPTGDGLQTALLVTRSMLSSGRPLSELLADFRTFPQILLNVRVGRKPDLRSLPKVKQAVADVESSLGSSGRLVLRYSGTEPLARIMIEGPDQAEVEALASGLANVISTEIGDRL